MDHGLRPRDPQHVSQWNVSAVVQSKSFELASDAANCSGCSVWGRRGSRDQCWLAHLHARCRPVGCAGSARSSNHRHRDLRSTHRTFFRKSQITHRRQRFLSATPSRNVDAEPLFPLNEFGQSRNSERDGARVPLAPVTRDQAQSTRTRSRHIGEMAAPITRV